MIIPFHWSLQVIIISIITLLVISGGIVYILLDKLPPWGWLLKAAIILPIIFAVVYCIYLTPLKLILDDSHITIKKVIGCDTINTEEIISIEEMPASLVKNSIRVVGSGGLFGYLGKFKNSIIGRYRMYATEIDNLVMIRTADEITVVSCSSREEFIKAVKRRIENPAPAAS